MKCPFCGFEYEESICFCPVCGKQIASENLSLNPISDRITHIFNDGLFLVICILMSAATFLQTIFSSLPIFHLLFTIFLWLCYAQGKKGFVEHKHIRSISGTVFAYYIVNYVLAGMVALAGFGLSMVLGMLEGTPELLEEISGLLDGYAIDFDELLATFKGTLSTIILVGMLLVAVVMLLVNIFGIRKIHKFLQSTYKSIEYNENRIVQAKSARTWLIILGAFSIFEAAIDYANAVSLAVVALVCYGICGIFAAVLINKHILVD